MIDYSELKRLASLAKNWSGEIGEDDWYTACCFDKPKFSVLDAEFIAKCEPGSVLALIAENERYLKLVERMVDQYVPLTELEGVPGHSRVVELVEVVAERDQLKTEVEGLLAQHGRDSAELRSLCQARDDARKERDPLKAEVEALRKDAERYRWLMSDAVMNGTLGIFGGWIDFEFKDEASKQIDEAMQEVKP